MRRETLQTFSSFPMIEARVNGLVHADNLVAESFFFFLMPFGFYYLSVAGYECFLGGMFAFSLALFLPLSLSHSWPTNIAAKYISHKSKFIATEMDGVDIIQPNKRTLLEHRPIERKKNSSRWNLHF